MNNANSANNVVGDLQLTGDINGECDEVVEQGGINKVKIFDESSMNGCIKRKIEFPNLK